MAYCGRFSGASWATVTARRRRDKYSGRPMCPYSWRRWSAIAAGHCGAVIKAGRYPRAYGLAMPACPWRVRVRPCSQPFETKPPITTARQRPPLSQQGHTRRQRFKDRPRFRRPSAHYRVQFALGHTTFTITGPDFVSPGFSRHMPLNFAFAITALTAAEAPPFSAIALARAASTSAIKLSSVTCAFATAAAVDC